MLKEQNYWLTTVPMPAAPMQPLPESADVAVIGAGFTGLSAALALARRGAKVEKWNRRRLETARLEGVSRGKGRGGGP